jgi:importin subunit beta-1
LESLSEVLSDINNDAVIRTAAALQLKNHLKSKDVEIRQQLQNRWLLFPENVRNYIKQNVVKALGTENSRPSSAAQCVACIAIAELPQNLWPELIPRLTQNVTNPNSTERVKESTLTAIGYICEDIDPDHLVSQSNNILTAIVHGMRKDEPSNHVKLAATNALHNSLEFTKANFVIDSERHFIMQAVCGMTQCEEIKVIFDLFNFK